MEITFKKIKAAGTLAEGATSGPQMEEAFNDNFDKINLSLKNDISPIKHTHTKSEVTDFPKNISEFENDRNYQTNTEVTSSISEHNTSTTAHQDIRTIITNLANNRKISNVVVDDKTGEITYTYSDDSVVKFNFLVANFGKFVSFDKETDEIVFKNPDDSETRIGFSHLIDIYTGNDGTHIQVTVSDDNRIVAVLKAGTVQEDRLTQALRDKINAKSDDGHTHAWSTLTGVPTTFEPSTHSHAWDTITSRPTTWAWSALTGVPTTFAPSTHSHAWSTLTGVPTAFAPSAHNHVWGNITDRPTTWAWGSLTGVPTTFTPAAHSHSASDVGASPSNHSHTWGNGIPANPNTHPSRADLGLATTDNVVFNRVAAPAGFFQESDEKLKNIQKLIDKDLCLSNIKKLKKVYYTLKNDKNQEIKIGVIAQEIKEYFPEIVMENEEGTLSVDYPKLSVLALSAIDNLDERLNKLEEIILTK